MKLTIAEIMLIIDTLGGSLCVANWWREYKHPPEDREKVLKKLFSYMNNVQINIEIENIGESSKSE